MGMILAGMVGGVGEGLLQAAKENERLELQRERLQQARELHQERLAQQLALRGGGSGSSSGGGKGGSTIAPEQVDELSMLENGYTKPQMDQMRQTQRDGAMREVPMASQPSAGEVDPSVGDDGYADRTTRMMQQQGTTIGTGMQQDAGLINQFTQMAPNVARSMRKTLQADDLDKIAKFDSSNQVGDLTKQYMAGDDRAGEAALIRDGKDAFSDQSSKASGKPTAGGKAVIAEKLGNVAEDLADAEATRTGAIKPKDMVSYLDSERKAITADKTDLRKREEELSDPAKSAGMTDSERVAARNELTAQRRDIQAREKRLQDMSAQVSRESLKIGGGKSGGLINGQTNPAIDAGRSNDRLTILRDELKDEKAKPGGGNPQSIAALEREIKAETKTPVPQVNGGGKMELPKPTDISAKPAIPKIASQADADAAIRQANEAIKNGKDPKLVRERLAAMGIKLQDTQ